MFLAFLAPFSGICVKSYSRINNNNNNNNNNNKKKTITTTTTKKQEDKNARVYKVVQKRLIFSGEGVKGVSVGIESVSLGDTLLSINSGAVGLGLKVWVQGLGVMLSRKAAAAAGAAAALCMLPPPQKKPTHTHTLPQPHHFYVYSAVTVSVV